MLDRLYLIPTTALRTNAIHVPKLHNGFVNALFMILITKV